MWLYASFEITLFAPVFVRAQSSGPMTMEMNVEGYDVEARLILKADVGRFKKNGDTAWHYMASVMEVTVARYVQQSANQGVQREYFKAEVLPRLQRIAERAANQLATFLKYKMWHPLFYAVEMCQEQGQIELVPMLVSVTADDLPDTLQACLDRQYSSDLSRSLLADADASINYGRNHRACLSLSLACEVALKSLFSCGGTSVLTKLLISHADSESFKEKYPPHYESISQLFQLRELLAEDEGGLFKCSAGMKQLNDRERLAAWQAAVECLVNESPQDERLAVDF